MNYELIETPSDDIVSIRLINKSSYFRPSATGRRTDLDSLIMKAKSEEYEDKNAGLINFKYFSSAAHYDKQISLKNAINEGIERMSVDLWWKYNRPANYYIDEIDGQIPTKYFSLKKGYDIRVMKIHNVSGEGFCCVAVLSNQEIFPYYVLGSSYEESPEQAVIKSCHEALQSWAATKWLINITSFNTPYWDYSELRRRLSNPVKSENQFPKVGSQDIFSKMKIINDQGTFISYINIGDGMVDNLILSSEHIVTYSESNF